MMIISNCDREISFTMAASSFTKPVIGQLAKVLNSIAVNRPEDGKKKGKGKVKLISPTCLKGVGTKFTEESKAFPRGLASIMVTNVNYIIDNVVDDETITIKENKEEIVELNKEFDYFLIPKIDNSVLFKEAYNRLGEDGCICIFPEGTSHDRTEFLKLKAGIALMTLGAMSENKCKPVNIVPVGLNYFNRDQMRSEVIIEFGKPFEIPSEWATEYLINKRHATEKLLNEIENVLYINPAYESCNIDCS
jgi:glycerol-3-phosphate O-acyltransferase/dihydroxyacetone phosphate acyltransferase